MQKKETENFVAMWITKTVMQPTGGVTSSHRQFYSRIWLYCCCSCFFSSCFCCTLCVSSFCCFYALVFFFFLCFFFVWANFSIDHTIYLNWCVRGVAEHILSRCERSYVGIIHCMPYTWMESSVIELRKMYWDAWRASNLFVRWTQTYTCTWETKALSQLLERIVTLTIS